MPTAGLHKLLSRRRLTIIGLNSGTSADGIDAAALTIARGRHGVRVTCLKTLGRRYPKPLRERILNAADTPAIDPAELIYLDTTLGRAFGRVALQLAQRLHSDGITVQAVASHGQTVRHLPQPTKYLGHRLWGTLQLGSLDHIAATTGLITIGDFRPADIAAGGEGAPITSAAVRRMLPPGIRSQLLVNIGGISNYFYFASPRSGLTDQAADCGPGNSLIDILAQRLFGRTYDRNGSLARRGCLSQRLLSLLRLMPPGQRRTLSTGREQFGQAMADEIIRQAKRLRLKAHDIMCTATELTALGIADAVRPLLHKDDHLQKLYLTGGGRHNGFLVSRLQDYLPDWPLGDVDETGFDGDYLEAASFAVMGEACLRSESLTLVSRQNRPGPILGHLVQPPNDRKN
ncbi:MAG: anhydro-N-acetylmuramic acid kinase [bacterium]